MRCAALIVLTMVALVLSACAGRKAEPWTLPTYGKPAPRYTPIPPLGERESKGGRVFIVADLDPKEDAAAIAVWKSPEVQAALDSVGKCRLLAISSGLGSAWDLPRPITGAGFFAYIDGREVDRDIPFTSSSALVDWIGRVRSGQIDEAYADQRLGHNEDKPAVSSLLTHAMRMMRLGLHDRAMESLMRAWDANASDLQANVLPAMLLRKLSAVHPPARARLSAMAEMASRSWTSTDFNGAWDPAGRPRDGKELSDAVQLAILRFALLCVASDRMDILESRIAACKGEAEGSQERNWLMASTSVIAESIAFVSDHDGAELLACSGRLSFDPKHSAQFAAMQSTAWLMMSDAPRESTLRQLEPDLRASARTLALLWCGCQAAGRKDEARDILLLLVERLDYPPAIETFLELCIYAGQLPSLTDEWLARKDLEPKRRELLREGVELLRRQPLMPVSAE